MVRGTDARAHRESKLRRVLHRVTASNEALADDDLQRSSLDAGASTIAEAKLRTRASLQGRIEVLTLSLIHISEPTRPRLMDIGLYTTPGTQFFPTEK